MAGPSTSTSAVTPTPTPGPSGKGIKGLFARARPMSPDGPPAPSARARLKTLLGDASRATIEATTRRSRRPPDLSNLPSAKTQERYPADPFVPSKQEGKTAPRKERMEQDRTRQTSPQPKRSIRIPASMLPAMQKDNDGRWQPPSLSRGSMSTSALAIYGDEADRRSSIETDDQGDRPSRQSLTSLFQPPKLPPSTPPSPLSRPGRYPPSSSTNRPRPRGSTTSLSGQSPSTPSRLMPPPSIPLRPKADTSQPLLSKEHYHLRIAGSYIVRRLSPLVRGSGFLQGGKRADLRKAADERLTILSRMERSWGNEWLKVSGALEQNSPVADGSEHVISPSPTKVRSVFVGENAKARERKAWVDALKDGILLCLLLNELLPCHPPRIGRIHITDDGVLRVTNLTRFITTCQTVGMKDADVFGVSDMCEGSEASLGRVAWTVVCLTRLAAQSNNIPTRRAATPSTPGSRPGSAASNASPSPGRIRRAHSPHRPPITVSPIVEKDDPISSAFAKQDFPGRLTSPKLHGRPKSPLPPTVEPTFKVASPHISPPRTPVTTSRQTSSATPQRKSVIRAQTQPEPLPSGTTNSISPPLARDSNGTLGSPGRGRPRLRPRYTTGARAQVTFASNSQPSFADIPDGLPNTVEPLGFHSRERTPSLISSGSRVTSSAYTRSSAALSTATILGEDNVMIADDDDDDDTHSQTTTGRPGLEAHRRMSGKTLHDARQRILGVLLSSDDLPSDLQHALRQSPGHHPDDPRTEALRQSLAALEGVRQDHQDLSVLEDDSASVASVNEMGSGTDGQGPPSMMRRMSANGKFQLPKRSISPSPLGMSPTSTAFPASSNLEPSRFPNSISMSRGPSEQSTYSRNDSRQSIILDRRRSESNYLPLGSSPNLGAGMHMNHSAVNLHLAASSPPSLFRSSSRLSRAEPMPVLEFKEAGKPSVKYQLGNFIGKGQFGTVYRALNLDTGQMVAIKRIALDGMEDHEIDDVMREVELLKRLDHPSIVKYEGMSRDPDYLSIILEFVENGSLGSVLKAFGKFNERLAATYTAKILEGLDYLHREGVVHCDLKAANILSTKNGNVKLTDFGVSLNTKAMENIQQTAMSGVMGTPNWMAPEVINLDGARPPSDIWSLGCTVIEMITSKPPFSDVSHPMAVMWRVVEGAPPNPPEGSSDDLTHFLSRCFEKDPDVRPTASELFEHPWIKRPTVDIQQLRPHDSMPFIRRLSSNFNRPESSEVFPSQIITPPMVSQTAQEISRSGSTETLNPRRPSSSSKQLISHRFIKTSFASPVPCRICHHDLKKGALLCQDCGMICHPTCPKTSTASCDLPIPPLAQRSTSHSAVEFPGRRIEQDRSRRSSANFDNSDRSKRNSRLSDISRFSLASFQTAQTAYSGGTQAGVTVPHPGMILPRRSSVRFDTRVHDEQVARAAYEAQGGRKEREVVIGVSETVPQKGHRSNKSDCLVM
ncbi:STE/STE11/CDC15 protein kinase [Tremella mesenterica]|uniref:STE/STE11/CDC15 protein kinase n=1 Tax=Tremella mesenterica TaxID=5217 RepID=A0A4Q1BWI2_TREME|nr:STE/STE11/CDC15 protein kinase [Tremella mesenterica]